MAVDTNGDGVADTPIAGFNYGIIPNDKDGSVWSGSPGSPGSIVRYDPATNKFERYRPDTPGSGPAALTRLQGDHLGRPDGSGHLASFDRSKCTQTWGDGTQCAEGWTFYRSPGP